MPGLTMGRGEGASLSLAPLGPTPNLAFSPLQDQDRGEVTPYCQGSH